MTVLQALNIFSCNFSLPPQDFTSSVSDVSESVLASREGGALVDYCKIPSCDPGTNVACNNNEVKKID